MIHAAKHLAKLGQTISRVMIVALVLDQEMDSPPPKMGRWEDEGIGFTGKDKKATIQPHDDALVVTLRIEGFDIRRVMID